MWLVKLRNWQLGNWEFCYPEYGIRNPGIGWKLREIKIRISEYGSWAVRDMGHGLYGKWVFGYTGSGNGSLDTGKMKRNLGNGYPFIPVRVVYTEKRSTMDRRQTQWDARQKPILLRELELHRNEDRLRD